MQNIMLSTTKNTIGGIYLVPFIIFFTNISVKILHPNYYENIKIEQDSSLVNQIMLSLAYFLAFKLALNRPGLIPRLLKNTIPLLILLFLTLISLFWSDFPLKVVISFIHNTGVSFIALCMATLLIQDKDRFFKLLLFTLCTYILATIAISTLRPDIGVMASNNIYDVTSINRWCGLTTHPNSLGCICLFTTWVSLSTIFYTKNKQWIYFIAIITLIADFYCLYKANSMTSILLSAALVFGILWLSFISNSIGGMKYLKIITGIIILSAGLMFLYIIHPELLSEKLLFLGIGRDASLSGRTNLWKIGYQGFTEKPFFGWSYDTLRTFLSQYELGYGQLHNGYLDLLVRGGLVSIFFFVVLLVQIFFSLIKQALKNNKDYVIILGLIVAVLLHNMTEASIISNTSIIWLMFLIGYFYCVEINTLGKLD